MKNYLTKELNAMRNNGDIWTSSISPAIRSYPQIRELLNDPHLHSCVQSRKSACLSLERKILPNGAKQTAQELVHKSLAKIDIPKLISLILDAPLFGFQALELTWDFDGLYYCVAKTEGRENEEFAFKKNGDIKFRDTSILKEKPIPDYKILFVFNERSQSNPMGVSLLAKCINLVRFKNGASKLWAELCEKFGLPAIIGQIERSSSLDESRELAHALAKMGANSALVVPNDIKVDYREPNKNASGALFADFIKYCNDEISKTILSQTLTSEISSSGSFAAANVHYKIRREIALADARLIESAFNNLFDNIIKVNMIDSPSPRFSLLIDDSDNQQRIERDKIIMQYSGAKFTKDYWINNYGFAIEDFEQ